ncbi:MAG: AmmeMemoRadiSam system protein A [Vallitaleaceae bacterium]|nr:AmmeMemoRadiSam system protein A [Vallitaleaceae bacterium]
MKLYEPISVLFSPHPPILLPEVGAGQERIAMQTLKGMERIASIVSEVKPDTIVYITPHGNSFSNGTCFTHQGLLKGHLGAFGHPSIQFEKNVDLELTEVIGNLLDEADIVQVQMDSALAKHYKISNSIDHGVLVPMYFIDQKYDQYQIVQIAPGSTSLLEQYKIGMAVRAAANSLNRKILIVASGDLSHCLKEVGSYTYHPMGRVFDEKIVDTIEHFQVADLIAMSPQIFEPAGQCGLRSFCMAFGALDGYNAKGEVFSYEGPFGVGYLTGCLTQKEPSASALEDIRQRMVRMQTQKLAAEDEYIQLARKTIENYIHKSKRLQISEIKEHFSQAFLEVTENKKSGIFVSLHKAGALRGCIGTILPVKDNILNEIIDNAISACSSDPRFDPVEEGELSELDIKVDVLSELEQISSQNELDVQKYGIVVEQGNKRGLLLPNLEGVDSIEQQIEIAMKKAGIKNNQNLKMYRFEVIRHEIPMNY